MSSASKLTLGWYVFLALTCIGILCYLCYLILPQKLVKICIFGAVLTLIVFMLAAAEYYLNCENQRIPAEGSSRLLLV